MNNILYILLSLSISGSLLALVIFLLKPLIRNKLSQNWQYYMWLIVLLRFLLPFTPQINVYEEVAQYLQAGTASFAVTESNDANQIPYENVTEDINSPQQVATSNVQTILTDSTAQEAQVTVQPTTDTVASSFNWSDIFSYACILWLVVSLIMFTRKVIGYNRFVRLVISEGKRIENSHILDIYKAECMASKVKKPLPLYINEQVASPMLVGFVRPAIVMPVLQVNEDELRNIFRHELVHYRRADFLYKWLVHIVICLHWFNPLVYLIRKEVNRVCELSCDETVIKHLNTDERISYGDALMATARAPGRYRDSVLSITMSENAKLVKERLNAMMSYKKRSRITIIVTISLTVLLLVGFALTGVYSSGKIGEQQQLPNSNSPLINEVQDMDADKNDDVGISIPDITTALIVGVDYEEYLTDVIILAVYDATTGSLDLISIPRDTRVVVDSELKTAYDEIGKSVPSEMKINAIHSYAGKTYGVEFIRNYIESLLDIEIDYYCKVNMEGFSNIIDGVGGIWLDVPQHLFHYDERDETHIDVNEGYQLLDGKSALGVVRYRSYAMGDLARIDMQQDFLQAFFEQVMNKETIIANPIAFVSTLIGYVNTDIGLNDISDYLSVLETLDPKKITFYTAEGYADDISYGASYYIIDEAAAATMIDDIIEENRNSDMEIEEAEKLDDYATASPKN